MTFADRMDAKLKELNDDYAVERRHALKDITVTVLPTKTFYDWMEVQGQDGRTEQISPGTEKRHD